MFLSVEEKKRKTPTFDEGAAAALLLHPLDRSFWKLPCSIQAVGAVHWALGGRPGAVDGADARGFGGLAVAVVHPAPSPHGARLRPHLSAQVASSAIVQGLHAEGGSSSSEVWSGRPLLTPAAGEGGALLGEELRCGSISDKPVGLKRTNEAGRKPLMGGGGLQQTS